MERAAGNRTGAMKNAVGTRVGTTRASMENFKITQRSRPLFAFRPWAPRYPSLDESLDEPDLLAMEVDRHRPNLRAVGHDFDLLAVTGRLHRHRGCEAGPGDLSVDHIAILARADAARGVASGFRPSAGDDAVALANEPAVHVETIAIAGATQLLIEIAPAR